VRQCQRSHCHHQRSTTPERRRTGRRSGGDADRGRHREPFFRILKTWTAEHRHGNATTAQFIALSERISGQDLGNFFQVWLYTPSKPTTW
jgi:hypothetical protein